MTDTIYLVQHGLAASEAEDPDRPLTTEGADEVGRVAAWAAASGTAVRRIRHSGKLRAEQTAAILARHLEPVEGIVEAEGLGPNDDPAPVAEALSRSGDGVMLVGHLPFLERLAALLTAGDAEAGVVGFHNGGIVCLGRDGDGWAVAWSVTPEVVG